MYMTNLQSAAMLLCFREMDEFGELIHLWDEITCAGWQITNQIFSYLSSYTKPSRMRENYTHLTMQPYDRINNYNEDFLT